MFRLFFIALLVPTGVSFASTDTPRKAPLALNGATVAELDEIEGVDGALAQRIVTLREDRGRLGSVEELRTLGLDGYTLDHIRDNVSMDLPLHKVARTSPGTVEEVLATFDHEPDVRSVQAMSMAYTKTSPELVDGWLNAARKAYLMPSVTLDYDKDLDQAEDYIYVVNDDGEAVAELSSLDLDNDDSFGVRLQWRLDKLIMSSERIRVINEAQDIAKLRDKVLDEVTRLYFDRRRLQVEMLLTPASDLQGRLRNELRLQELTANLDAYTGGTFSGALHGS